MYLQNVSVGRRLILSQLTAKYVICLHKEPNISTQSLCWVALDSVCWVALDVVCGVALD